MQKTESNPKSPNMIQRIGTKANWRKLPNDIRIIINKGLIRLTRIHHAISTDANLPMPSIHVEPWGWVFPDSSGAIFARVAPIASKGYSEFGVIVPGATLVVTDDDNLLRRIICHEFAHCFWYYFKAIEKSNAGESKFINAPLGGDSLERLNRIVQKDKDELVDPNDFFGKWDTENFFYYEPDTDYGSYPALDAATDALAESWINKGLPTRTPSLKFDVRGKIGMRNEIKERIENLLKIKKIEVQSEKEKRNSF